MTTKYRLATDTWDNREIQAINRVISSQKYTMGEEVANYESMFANKFGSQFAVMSNSGSSANLLALSAIKYSSFSPRTGKNEVIVPAVSWGTTYFPIHQLGFTLKFVDIDLGTLNASPKTIEEAISPKTAGIVAVNLLGNPSELKEIRRIADANNLFLIEDNCESMGAIYEDQYAGTFGDIGTFSSFFSHHISTMEGGMGLTNSLELFEISKSLRAHGWTRDLPEKNHVFDKSGVPFEDLFRFVLPGYNLRPLEIEGAIGREQIAKLDRILQGRRANAEKFKSLMGQYPDLLIQTETGQSSWFGFSVVLTGKFAGFRDILVQVLNDNGVEARPIVAGNFCRNPVLKHLSHSKLPPLPVADKIHDDGLFLGNHHYEMHDEFEVLDVAIQTFITRATKSKRNLG